MKTLVVMIIALSSLTTWAQFHPYEKCYNPVIEKVVNGYPLNYKKHMVDVKGRKMGICLQVTGRLPTVKIGSDQKNPNTIIVRNFSHHWKLYYAVIDMNKITGAIAQFLKFAPLTGIHSQARIEFQDNDAIKLYSKSEDIVNRANQPDFKLDSMVLSIEGMPVVGDEYSFSGAINKKLAAIFRIASTADKKNAVHNWEYPTKQYQMLTTKNRIQRFVELYLEESKKVGLKKDYDLFGYNCTNVMIDLMRTVAKQSGTPTERILSRYDRFLSTAPVFVPRMFHRLGLINRFAPLANFEVDDTVNDYDREEYNVIYQEYLDRSKEHENGDFVL
jgi:hypothetical protein